jgi:hypothetical protein
MNGDSGIVYVPIIDALLHARAEVEAAYYPTGSDRVDELLRRYGANS